MKRFRANNLQKQNKSFKGSNPFLPDENDLPDYLLLYILLIIVNYIYFFNLWTI